MKTSKRGLDLIKEYEGFRADAYLCPAGVWTIGYGTTKGVKKGDKVTKEQAERMLADDVAAFEQSVISAVKVPLNQNQFDALVSLTYNLGAGNLRSSTLLRMLNTGDYTGAAEQFLRWNKAGGKVLAGLTRRRESERALFLEPA